MPADVKTTKVKLAIDEQIQHMKSEGIKFIEVTEEEAEVFLQENSMEVSDRDWATPTLKEAPYYHPGITPEEYDAEREYYCRNFDLVQSGQYVPLWKQKTEK